MRVGVRAETPLMARLAVLLGLLLLAAPVQAQQPVNALPDWASYPTAFVNPAIAAIHAARSSDRWCELSRLGISEMVGNGIALSMKRYLPSERPCLGCLPDGMPSGHTMNSAIGILSSRWGFTATIATGVLRHQANRHTWQQVAVGAFVGVFAEAAGRLVKCDQ